MAPRSAVLYHDVLDLFAAAAAIVIGQLRVEATHRIEPVEKIEPLARHLHAWKAVFAAPARLQLVLNLIQAEWTADGDQAIDPPAFGDALQTVISDHRAHAVRDHDVRAGDSLC